jgi:hypothetical protein
MTSPNDIFGFSREARQGTTLDRYQRGPCLKLMIHLYDKAQAEGRHYDNTDRQLHTDVMAGKTPCPLQHKCTNYRAAIQRGGTPLHLIPHQLTFADYQASQQHGG